MPEGVQPHPHCKHAVTHDTAHVAGKTLDEIPWRVPEGLQAGDTVVFRATVVREYSTWFAFERAYVVGSLEGGGSDAPVALAHAPDGEPAPEQAQPRAEQAEAEAGAQVPALELAEAEGGGVAAGDRLATLAARRRQLRLLHALVMAAAWLLAAPAGALAARSFKARWLNVRVQPRR